MSIGTGLAGGFAVPFVLDPSIILSGSGALNPVRSVARVITITGAREWKGVSRTASSPATSPRQPRPPTGHRCSRSRHRHLAVEGLRSLSIELSQDWGGIQEELVQLAADARDVNDATQFLTGAGTTGPGGILNIGGTGGLTTTQKVLTATTATYAVGDPWLLKAAIPPRFLATSTFAAAPGTWDTTYRFVAQGSTTEPRQFADGDRGGDFLGRPNLMVDDGDRRRRRHEADHRRRLVEVRDRRPSGHNGRADPALVRCSTREPSDRPARLVRVRPHGRGVLAPNAFRYLESK